MTHVCSLVPGMIESDSLQQSENLRACLTLWLFGKKFFLEGVSQCFEQPGPGLLMTYLETPDGSVLISYTPGFLK